MLTSRVISGLIFLIFFWLGLFIPQLSFILPLILLGATLWGTHEFLHLSQVTPSRPHQAVALAGAVALIADAYFFKLEHVPVILGLMTIVALALGLKLQQRENTEMASLAVLGPIYVALPLALITMIWLQPTKAHNENGPHYLIFLILVTWASDIGAFFVGRKLGRHKLAPTLSPGKTWEGFFGGVALTLLVAILTKLFWNNIDRIFQWWEVIFLALVFSVLGPIGDLTESWMKRSSGHKDSGHTFTGHGGMLDIIDSLLFTAVFYYGYLWAFHKAVLM